MAPRKSATVNAKATKKPVTKQRKDRVVKRPARGYHIFRNGMPKVKPKGWEKDLVKTNQTSPLLRLPAEIRNRIFQYVLGGNIVRERRTTLVRNRFFQCALDGNVIREQPKRVRINCHHLLLPPHERQNAFALLRTSRQIYAETSLVPYNTNIFTKERLSEFDGYKKLLKKYQRTQISNLRFEVLCYELSNVLAETTKAHLKDIALSKWFPGLRRVHFCIFPCPTASSMTFSTCVETLREHIEPVFRGIGCDVTIEEMSVDWQTFDDN